MSQSQKKKNPKGRNRKAGRQRVRLDLAAAERKAELLLARREQEMYFLLHSESQLWFKTCDRTNASTRRNKNGHSASGTEAIVMAI